MKALLLFTLMLLSAGVASPSAADASKLDMKTQNPLLGAWKLVSLEQPGAHGRLRKVECAGMFVFTDEGKVSVQVMYRNAKMGGAYAQSGYEASYGSYRVDNSSTFTFHIDGALVRSLVGKDLKRAYAISDNRLTVKSTDPTERWEVVWERY